MSFVFYIINLACMGPINRINIVILQDKHRGLDLHER